MFKISCRNAASKDKTPLLLLSLHPWAIFCLLNYNFIFEMLKNNRGVRVFFTLERFTYVITFALMLTSFARWSLPKEEERHRKKTILFPLWSVAVHKSWQGTFARLKYFWGIAHNLHLPGSVNLPLTNRNQSTKYNLVRDSLLAWDSDEKLSDSPAPITSSEPPMSVFCDTGLSVS